MASHAKWSKEHVELPKQWPNHILCRRLIYIPHNWITSSAVHTLLPWVTLHCCPFTERPKSLWGLKAEDCIFQMGGWVWETKFALGKGGACVFYWSHRIALSELQKKKNKQKNPPKTVNHKWLKYLFRFSKGHQKVCHLDNTGKLCIKFCFSKRIFFNKKNTGGKI